jgi:hypothetical protein
MNTKHCTWPGATALRDLNIAPVNAARTMLEIVSGRFPVGVIGSKLEIHRCGATPYRPSAI